MTAEGNLFFFNLSRSVSKVVLLPDWEIQQSIDQKRLRKRAFHTYSHARQANLCDHARAAGLNGLDLGLRPRSTPESLRQLVPIKVFTRSRLDGAEGSARVPADEAAVVGGGRTSERAVLLGSVAVRGEGLWQLGSGRCWMDTGAVVDGFCRN